MVINLAKGTPFAAFYALTRPKEPALSGNPTTRPLANWLGSVGRHVHRK